MKNPILMISGVRMNQSTNRKFSASVGLSGLPGGAGINFVSTELLNRTDLEHFKEIRRK